MEFRPRSGPDVDDPKLRAVVQWMEAELQRLARSFTEDDILNLRVLNVEPERPREGMIAHADGTNWNPGAGAGPYSYIGGAWTKLKP
jgi:hypothetical protein